MRMCVNCGNQYPQRKWKEWGNRQSWCRRHADCDEFLSLWVPVGCFVPEEELVYEGDMQGVRQGAVAVQSGGGGLWGAGDEAVDKGLDTRS